MCTKEAITFKKINFVMFASMYKQSTHNIAQRLTTCRESRVLQEDYYSIGYYYVAGGRLCTCNMGVS